MSSKASFSRRIGVGSEACGAMYPQHSCHYRVDESALLNGALVYAQVAADYLI